jgi:ABC-type transport system involved in multi-copper enzyme maturation permease subunit
MTTATTRERRGAVPPSADSFGHVLRAEWTKFWSVRSTAWTFAALVVATAGISALICWAVAASFDDAPEQAQAGFDAVSVSLAGIILGQAAVVVLGCLTISAEYTSGGIRTTLTAVPHRVRLLLAKAVVLAAITFVAGVATMLLSFSIGQLVLSTADAGLEVGLGDDGVLRAVVGGGLYIVACGLLGFAVGALLRHTAGAITTTLGILFVLPIIGNFLPGDWGQTVRKFINAGNTIFSTTTPEGQLGPWEGYAVFSLWWVVLLAVAAVLIRRRDA